MNTEILSSEAMDASNMQGSQNQSLPTTESESSSDIEEDVKVCDICGDAGQEELLAICSRCIDGAEHTYCMRIILDKLPEGDWLCEECNLKEETGNKKEDTSVTVSGALEVPCLNGNNQNIGSTSNPKIFPELYTEAIDSEARGAGERLQSPQISSKCYEDNPEVKPSAERNLREGSNKSNKWKEAVGTMISKTRIQKNNRLPDHSDLSCEVTSKDFPSGLSSCISNVPYLEGITEGKETFKSPIVDPNIRTAIIDVNLQAAHQFEALSATRTSDLDPIVTFPDVLNVKPSTQVLPNRASVANILRASVIPELEFIWQGGFEVLGSGKLPKLCDGVQAHLSTYASPKVLEIAAKFPCKFQLEEVPSLSSWPLQGISPEEHNIGLFFFAKDVESYEKNYWRLLENMLKNDLALKGDFDGVELLIFPSNKLPENSQRWNRLFFLWGIFRGKRSNCLETHPDFQEKPCGSILNLEPLVPDLPKPMSEVSTAKRTKFYENTDDEISVSDSSTKGKAVKSSICVDFQPISSSGIEGRIFHTQESPLVQESLCPAAVDDTSPSERTSRSLPVSCSSENISQLPALLVTSPESTLQVNATQLCSGVKSNATYRENLGSESEVRKDVVPLSHVDAILPMCTVSSNCRQGAECSKSEETMEEKDSLMKGEAVAGNNPGGNPTELRPDSTGTLSCASNDALESSGEIMPFQYGTQEDES